MIKLKIYLALVLFFTCQFIFSQPILNAIGNDNFCPGETTPVVSQMFITPDPTSNDLTAVYIQISSGYQSGTDLLILTGSHPQISTSWSALTGKLELRSTDGSVLTPEVFENAIESVHYQSNSTNTSGTKNFSITVGQANYLPSTNHYYRFIPSIGITWEQARIAAQNSNYYGLQGYLATILAEDEAILCGEQSEGTGWIGGSDALQEGVWRWVTGPESGTIFWNQGTTLTFANWNVGEPNNAGNEHYAHVTAPGIGSLGSWNDLSNTGAAYGDYQPKGYIVEYGGMPGDLILQISTSTTLTIPQLISLSPSSRCGNGTLNLQASATSGATIYWYENPTSGTPIHTGSSFTTPILTETKSYYISVFGPTCTNAVRSEIKAIVHPEASINIITPAANCEGIFTIQANSPTGQINWYSNLDDIQPIATGLIFTTPFLNTSTTFYAEAISDYCPSSTRIPVVVRVFQKPELEADDLIAICDGSTIILDSGVSGQQYLWSTGQTSSAISVHVPGVYSVRVTNVNGCFSDRTFTVLTQYAPIIQSVVVTGTQLQIFTQNSGEFEYSIDGVNFQDSPIFYVNGSPIQEIVVQEKNHCGEDRIPFEAGIEIPSFFTPNNDGYNDFWTVKGLIFYPGANLQIFNRHGKLLKHIDTKTLFWDGTYLSKPMPSDDYWYRLDLNNGQEILRGHFTLKR